MYGKDNDSGELTSVICDDLFVQFKYYISHITEKY